MSVHLEDIENVRAFVLPDGIAADGGCAAIGGAALVTWRSSQAGRLHQAYVNGHLAGVTLDSEQRQLVVQLPASFESAVRVEIVAVDPADAGTDFRNDLELPQTCDRVRLSILRSQTLPLGARANVYFDNATGAIDYDHPLNPSPIPIWPCPQDKAGFGMSEFGDGDFGYDSAACIGFGKGSFAHGQFGLDADTIEWVSPVLASGRYRFAVKVMDAHGDESAASETDPIAILPPARPAGALAITTFEPQTNQVTLSVSDQ